MTSRTGQRRVIPPINAEEQFQLTHIVKHGPARFERRAQVILMADQGTPVMEIAARLGLSKSGVHYWLRRFKSEHMSIIDEARPSPADDTEQSESKPDDAPVKEPRKKAISLEELRRRYSADLPHAAHVTRLALQIFDATQDVHGLAEDGRALLRTAAAVHNIAFKLDPDKYHILGRDILLEQPLEGMSKTERRMLASIVALHRKKARPGKEPVFERLKRGRQRQVLALAAVLRVANSLDFSHTQTTTIADIRRENGFVVVVVEGDYADLNAVRAARASDLWQERFEVGIQVRERFPVEAVRDDVVWARLNPDLSMTETGRMLMGHYLMLAEQHAAQLRDGLDDALPMLERDLARLQGVFTAFGDYYDVTALGDYKKHLRWLYRQVDDALHVQALAALVGEVAPAAESPEVADDDWPVDADGAMEDLRDALDSTRYREFLTGLLGLCRKKGAGAFPGPHNTLAIGTQAAQLVSQEYSRVRVEALSATDTEEQWRRVRGLHNMLQYLGGLFGPELSEVLTTLQPLDAGLRSLVTGQAVLQSLDRAAADLTDPDDKRNKKGQVRIEATQTNVQKLIVLQQERLAAVQTEIEPLWAAIDSAEFRRKLMEAIAVP